MKVRRCWRCSWLNPENHERKCYACGMLLHEFIFIDEKSLTEVKNQPSWYMYEKGKSDEEEMQQKLDDWQLEIFL